MNPDPDSSTRDPNRIPAEAILTAGTLAANHRPVPARPRVVGMRPNGAPTVNRRAFSLVEMLVVLLIVGILLGGLLTLFSRSTYIARTQSDLAVLQQSLRVAHGEMSRYLRMAGSGGLPVSWNTIPTGVTINYDDVGSFPNGFAVRVENNVAEGTTIGGLPVVPGSDVLTVRGVFTTPVYYLGDGVNVGAMIAANQIAGTPIFVSEEVNKAFDFDLQPLIGKINDGLAFTGVPSPLPLPVILRDVTNPDAYFVAQLDYTNTNATESPCPTTATPVAWGAAAASANCIQVGVKFRNSDSDTKSLEFGNLSFGTILEETGASAFQLNMPTGGTKGVLNVPRNVHSLGILEEFQYFLRVDYEVPGDASTRFRPILARAELVPNTDIVIDTVDIAEGIIDLQLAIGFETEGLVDPGGEGVPDGYGTISDSGDNNDEILFNSPNDVLVNPPELAGLTPAVWYNPVVEKHFIRITTLAESKVPNLNFWTPRVELIEDHDLRDAVNLGGATWNASLERRFPRSYLRTVVEMRNLK